MKTAALITASLAVISALDVKLSGLNYSPRKGADWAGPNKCKTPAEITSDLAIMKTVTDDIRLYSMRECNQMPTVLTVAKALGLKVWAGMWVDGNEGNFQEEKAAFANLLKREDLDWNVVSGLHVGSEAVYRKEITADQAIEYFKDVKKMLADTKYKFPVTIADIGDTYIAYPQLVDAVDIVSANAFPFWEKKPIEGCIDYFYSRMQPLIQLANQANKKIMMGESGWASSGNGNPATSIASPENAAIWLKDFHSLMKKLNWKYYYYTSFDTNWKVINSTTTPDMDPENYFGIFGVDGKLKPCFTNVVTITTQANTVANTIKDIPTSSPSTAATNDNDDSSTSDFSIPTIRKGTTGPNSANYEDRSKARKTDDKATDGSMPKSSCAMSPTASLLLVSILVFVTARL